MWTDLWAYRVPIAHPDSELLMLFPLYGDTLLPCDIYEARRVFFIDWTTLRVFWITFRGLVINFWHNGRAARLKLNQLHYRNSQSPVFPDADSYNHNFTVYFMRLPNLYWVGWRGGTNFTFFHCMEYNKQERFYWAWEFFIIYL